MPADLTPGRDEPGSTAGPAARPAWLRGLPRWAQAPLYPGPVTMRRVALAGVAANAGIIMTGAAVRLSASGLGCPDWPDCTSRSLVAAGSAGQPIFHTYIEFTNRMLTFVLMVVAVLVMITAWRYRPGGSRRPVLVWLAVCSTPFGITEGGMRLSRLPRDGRRVLNAFRHHRGGHIGQRARQAQAHAVLNAFRHHRGGHRPFVAEDHGCRWCSTPSGIIEGGISERGRRPAASSSAQRLSASQRGASGPGGGRDAIDRVLNAFRHHRGGHNRVYGLSDRSTLVLNAFRHHRGGHSIGPYRLAIVVMCSTPFGITEGGMGPPPPAWTISLGAQRLSASQRGASTRRPHGVVNIHECSTPFGITEGGMSAGTSGGPSRPSAQRLSASQRGA